MAQSEVKPKHADLQGQRFTNKAIQAHKLVSTSQSKTLDSSLRQNLSDMVTLSQKRNCLLQKDVSIKFTIVFTFQYKAEYSTFYLTF